MQSIHRTPSSYAMLYVNFNKAGGKKTQKPYSRRVETPLVVFHVASQHNRAIMKYINKYVVYCLIYNKYINMYLPLECYLKLIQKSAWIIDIQFSGLLLGKYVCAVTTQIKKLNNSSIAEASLVSTFNIMSILISKL